jgi:hypothetical protein
MKTILAYVIAFLCLGVSVVRADDKKQDKLDPLDSCQVARADLEAELGKVRRELAILQLRMKYRLADGDTVDPQTLAITRAKIATSSPPKVEPRK